MAQGMRLRVSADPAEFRRTIRQLEQETGSKSIDFDVTADTTQFDASMDRAESSTEKVGASLKRLAVLAAAAFAAVGVQRFGSALLGLAGDAAQTEAALSGLYEAAGHGADEAAAAVALLNEQFASSQFPLSLFQQGAQSLAYLGLNAQQTADTMKFMEQAIIATGGGADQFQQATDALGRMASLGRVTADEINSLSLAGVPIRDMLREFGDFGEGAEGFAGLADALSAGAISLEDVLAAMEAQSGQWATGLLESAEQVQQTLPAIMASLQNEILNTLASGIDTTAIAEAVQSLQAGLGPLLTEIGGAISAIFGGLAPALEPLGLLLGDIVGAITPILPPLAELVSMLVGALAPALSAIVQAAAPVLSTLAQLVTNVLTPIMPVIETLANTIAAILVVALEAVGVILEALEPLLILVAEVFQELEPIIEELGAAFAELLPPIADIIVLLVGALLPILQPLMPLIGMLAQVVAIPLVTALTILNPLLELVAQLLELVLGAVVPLIAGLVGLVAVILEGVVGAFIVALEWVQDLAGGFGDLIEGITSALEPAIEWVQRFAEGVSEWFSSIIEWIRDVIGWFEDLLSKVTGVVDTVSGALSSVGEAIGFADGGIVTTATPAIVGEAGAEVIIPLTRPARAAQLVRQSGLADVVAPHMTGGSDSSPPIAVTVNAAGLSPALVEARVERAIRRALGGGRL